MAHLIDKSALVAEIEKLIDEIYADRPFDSLSREQQTALWYVKSIMSSINTLEVKEVQEEPSIPEIVDEHYWEMLGEEPVSEELCDAANDYGVNIRKGYPRVMDETDRYICNAFKAGAQWQKKQDQSTIELAEDHAMLAGMEKMKEQIIKDAVEGIVCSQRGDMAIVKSSILFPTNLMKGEKVKLIIVKEDWR